MGAGAFRAGIGPAGFSPAQPNLSMPGPGPRAALFDPLLKTFPLNADGSFVDIHWVDQAMAFTLCVPAGSISAAPDVGNTLGQIPRAAGDRVAKQAEDRVNQAVAALVAEGLVQIVLIAVSNVPIPNGLLLVDVAYVNLVTGTRMQITGSKLVVS